jgi:hypothetical protein
MEHRDRAVVEVLHSTRQVTAVAAVAVVVAATVELPARVAAGRSRCLL